jgi:hypothetical protein
MCERIDRFEAFEVCGVATYTLQCLILILLFLSKIWGRLLTHQLVMFFLWGLLLCHLAEMIDQHYSYIHTYSIYININL